MASRAEPRSAALEMLKKTRQGAPLDAMMSDAMDELSPRDRRLAHEIAAGVLRHRRVIDREIKQRLTRPEKELPANVQDILRIGTYQLTHLDKVPSYAAVSSAVDLARGVGGKKTAGLVNAVLRKLAKSGTVIDVSACSLAERFSHPDWLVNRWQENFGLERTVRLLEHFNTRPSLVIQPARWDEAMLVHALREAGVAFTTSSAQHGIAIDGGDVTTLPGYAEGAFIVQDPAQKILLDFAAIPENTLVWDACAAPGGKAVTLAHRRAVVATDLAPARVNTLRENRDRVAPSIHLTIADATKGPFKNKSFDAVLVDAPCSGTGSMARHPDARWSLREEKIERSANLQYAILDATAPSVKPGGLLVYLTCSLEPEENEDQVDRFLANHSEFERTRDDLSIFPPDQKTDGGFGARLRRAM